jgi:hypothetical protein
VRGCGACSGVLTRCVLSQESRNDLRNLNSRRDTIALPGSHPVPTFGLVAPAERARLRAPPEPGTASEIGGSGGAVISSRRARGLPDRRSGPQAGKDWLALRTTGPAGWNPRREEITTSSRRGVRTKITGPFWDTKPPRSTPKRPHATSGLIKRRPRSSGVSANNHKQGLRLRGFGVRSPGGPQGLTSSFAALRRSMFDQWGSLQVRASS